MQILLAALIALSPATAPPTPQIPPSPAYIGNGDGSRMICTPDYTTCWPDPTAPLPGGH
jgi:hypothetical protein